MERGRQFRVATQVLTALAAVLALGSVAATLLAGGATAGFLLAFGTLVLSGAVYATDQAVTHYDKERESHTSRRRRKRLSLAVTVVLGTLLSALLFVETVAVLTGLGFFTFFGDMPRLVIRYYDLPVAAMLLAFSAAVGLRTQIPGDGEARGRERWVGVAALVAAGLLVFLGLSINGGIAQSMGLVDSPPDRAPFVLALAFFPLFTALRVFTRYPAPRAAVSWMGDAVRAEERNLGELVLAGSSMASLALVAFGGFLHYGFGETATALGLSAVGVVVLLAVPVGIGFTRVVEEIEQTREDYEARRRRRRATLLGFTGLHTLLALAAVVLAVAAPFLRLTPIVATHFPVVFLAVGLAAIAGAVARTRIQAEDEYTRWRKALGSQLVAVVSILAFLGVFLAAELAEGPIVGTTNAALVLTGAWGLSLLYVKNRLLLPSVFAKIVAKYQERQERVEEKLDPDEKVQRSMLAAYVASGVLLVLGLAVMAMMFLGKVPSPPTQGTQIGLGALWIVALMVAGGLGIYRQLQQKNIETVQTQDEGEQVIGERRFKKREVLRYSILGFSFSLALVLFVIGGLVMAEVVTSLAGRPIAQKYSTDFFVFGLLLGLGPYGYFHAREQKRIRAMDKRLPEFLRDLAESKRAGMTLTEAIITASQGTYGELTPEIRKMAAQLEWGVSFTEALTRFSHRVDTPLVERTVNLIVEASNAGGNVVDVLSAAADDAREIQQILQERRDSMIIYVMIIYVAFLVFLGVIGVLNAQFIPEISKAVSAASERGAPSIGGLQFSNVDTQAFKTLFFHAAVIQGLGGGLVAGVMRGGKPVEGLKHSFAMIALAYVIFRVFLGA